MCFDMTIKLSHDVSTYDILSAEYMVQRVVPWRRYLWLFFNLPHLPYSSCSHSFFYRLNAGSHIELFGVFLFRLMSTEILIII